MDVKNKCELIKEILRISMMGCVKPTHELLRGKALALAKILPQLAELDLVDVDHMLKDLEAMTVAFDLMHQLSTPGFAVGANSTIQGFC